MCKKHNFEQAASALSHTVVLNPKATSVLICPAPITQQVATEAPRRENRTVCAVAAAWDPVQEGAGALT